MLPRASWTGSLRLSLVSVPVQAFTADESGGGKIHFNRCTKPATAGFATRRSARSMAR